jgi:Hint domain
MIAAGTLIATKGGDVPAEALRPGAYVYTLEDGEKADRPLRWVGTLAVDLAHHPTPARAAPVRIAAGALAPGQPARDLLVSPDHAVLVAGGLFQAQALRNGATIAQAMALPKITYVHLELGRHGVLLAEGAAIESYLDTGHREIGNRGRFAHGRAMRGLAPDLSLAPSAAALALWKTRGCAPLWLDSASIVPAQRMLAARAATLGWSISPDPALAVFADGMAVPLARFSDEHFQARLPAGARAIRLATRAFVPAEADPTIADRRRLGLAVRSLRLHGKPLRPGAFGRGWHLSEPEWRWTDGDARLTLRALPEPATLEIRTAPGAVPGYWVPSA